MSSDFFYSRLDELTRYAGMGSTGLDLTHVGHLPATHWHSLGNMYNFQNDVRPGKGPKGSMPVYRHGPTGHLVTHAFESGTGKGGIQYSDPAHHVFVETPDNNYHFTQDGGVDQASVIHEQVENLDREGLDSGDPGYVLKSAKRGSQHRAPIGLARDFHAQISRGT